MKSKYDMIESMLRTTDKDSHILYDIFKGLYEAIGVSFLELCCNADLIEINGTPVLDIPFESYEIDEQLFYNIVNEHTKGLPKRKKRQIRNTVLLGCSPKFIKQ